MALRLPAVARLPLATAALLLLSAAGRGADELYIVTAREAALYRDGRAVLWLRAEDLVTGTPSARYADWLDVTLEGGAYQGAARDFLSAAEWRIAGQRQRAELDGRLAALAARLADTAQARRERVHAAAAVRLDSTILYRTRLWRTTVSRLPGGPAPGPGPAPTPPAVTVESRPTYRYEDKLSPSRARRLAADWQEEIQTLDKTLAATRRDLADVAVRRARAEVNLRLGEARQARFTRDPAGYRDEPWITIARRTALYEDRALRAEVGPGLIFTGRPSPRYPDWVTLQYQGRTVSARAADLRSRSAAELEFSERAARLARAQEDAEAEVARLREEIALADAMLLVLDQAGSSSRVPVAGYPFAPAFPGRRLYSLPLCPDDTLEILEGSRARRLSRDLEEELEALRTALRSAEAAALKARADAAETAARQAEQDRRFRDLQP